MRAESQRSRSSPLCPTTPGGLPVALLVERPRRRRLPRALALATLVVAVAVPGYGRVRPPAPRPAATVNRPSTFLALARERGALSPAPDPEVSVPGVRALALAGERTVALRLLAPREGYGAPVQGARVVLRGLAAARWRVTWVDDESGEPMATEEQDVGGAGEAVLVAPTFVRHVAAIVERVE